MGMHVDVIGVLQTGTKHICTIMESQKAIWAFNELSGFNHASTHIWKYWQYNQGSTGSHALCLTIVILITHIGYLDSINANEYM